MNTVGSSSAASPGFMASARDTSSATKASWMSAETIMRLLELQAWPMLYMRVAHAVRAASAGSSASSTMYGSDPPSSRTAFLRCWPASAPITEPARSEPVRETPATRGSAMNSAIWSCVAKTLVYTPAGTPASSMICCTARAERGQISACLSTIALPSMRFGAAKRAIW